MMGHTIDMLIEELKAQIERPKADLEHNLRSVLNEFISKMDLVSQEELERQKTALVEANAKLAQLQAQFQAIEDKIKML